MQNTQIVTASSAGWIGIAGLGAMAFSLVVLWAVNDKYASSNDKYNFVTLQLQLVTDNLANQAAQNKELRDRIELLEIREKKRSEDERNKY